jgi:hypothetical protein
MNLAIALIEAYIISHHQGRLARIYRHIWGHIGWSCFWIVTVASLLIGLFWQIGVELFPYVLFFFIVIILLLLLLPKHVVPQKYMKRGKTVQKRDENPHATSYEISVVTP